MAEDFQSYLASAVLSDDQIVTFRVLSRALNVNSFGAKKMLYLFHQRENAKRAGSVHASYIVTGIRKSVQASHQTEHTTSTNFGNEDVQMQGNSFPGSSMIQDGDEHSRGTIQTTTLVREDRLNELKSLYTEVHSISMYSVQSSPLKNLDRITSVYEQLHHESQSIDPLQSIKTYGSIQNPNVRRRASHRPPPPPSQEGASMSKASAKAMFQKSSDNRQINSNNAKNRVSSKTKSDEGINASSQGSQPSSSPGSRPPAIKRESSSIFKSFAKAKAPKQKPEAGKTSGPTDSSASGAHSMPIGDLSTRGDVKLEGDANTEENDEGDSDSQFAEHPKASVKPHKSKAEREAELHKRIFDDDDDSEEENVDKDRDSTKATQEDEIDADASDKEMPDAPGESDGKVANDEDEEMMDDQVSEKEEAEDDDQSEVSGGKASEQDQKVSSTVTSTAGRRRGRRRVTRKRMIKDADGYLVTKEEPGWESFSEDEPAAPASAPVTKSKGHGQLKGNGKGSSGTPPSSSASAGTKKGSSQPSGTAKKGQGNIMSFFGKK